MNTENNEQNFNLVEESTVPLYFQLLTLLKRQIHSGILKSGDLVPSESQLCEKFGVSRTTVRKALNQLAEENLILRRRGKGTYIASQKLHRNLNHLYSFTEDMLSMNLNPRSQILESSTGKASNEIAGTLNLPDTNLQVFKLTRIRLANDEPLLIETTYIPLYLCPDITREDLASSSLYSLLRNKYNLDLHKAIETIEAIKLNKETSALLKCKPSSTAFRIQRTAYLAGGTAFELTQSVARSDKCVFQIELYANKNKVNFARRITL